MPQQTVSITTTDGECDASLHIPEGSVRGLDEAQSVMAQRPSPRWAYHAPAAFCISAGVCAAIPFGISQLAAAVAAANKNGAAT